MIGRSFQKQKWERHCLLLRHYTEQLWSAIFGHWKTKPNKDQAWTLRCITWYISQKIMSLWIIYLYILRGCSRVGISSGRSYGQLTSCGHAVDLQEHGGGDRKWIPKCGGKPKHPFYIQKEKIKCVPREKCGLLCTTCCISILSSSVYWAMCSRPKVAWQEQLVLASSEQKKS